MTAQIADYPADVERLFIDFERMLDSYEIERLQKVRDIGKAPHKLWGNLADDPRERLHAISDKPCSLANRPETNLGL